jgi:hypothetical protein
MRLNVAIETNNVHGDQMLWLREAIDRLNGQPAANYQFVDDLGSANWLIRCGNDGNSFLVPAEGWSDGLETVNQRGLGPIPQGAGSGPWLHDRLNRLAKVKNLLALSTAETDPWQTEIQVELQLVKLHDSADWNGELLSPGPDGFALTNGQLVGFKINNYSNCPVDVTLLFFDNSYGIRAVYPKREQILDNRIDAGESRVCSRQEVVVDAPGKERMLMIAVKAGAQPVNFIQLAQPAIERVQGETRDESDGRFSLFQSAAFGGERWRGQLSPSELRTYVVQCVSWRTVNQPHP